MSTWKDDFVTANGIRLHYWRTGGDKPKIVLAHGITDNGLCWIRVARALEADYDVIMYDARLHGLSDSPETPFTWETMGDDAAGLVQALGLVKPAMLGHSMGAATAAACAANYPDLLGCALLSDPPFRDGMSRSGPDDHTRQGTEQVKTYKTLGKEGMLAMVRERSPLWHEEELEPWAEAKLQVNPRIWELVAWSDKPWRETVRAIQCPTLLLTADPDKGAIITPEIGQEAASLMSQGKWVRIEGAGHNIRREAFTPYMKAVRAFLSEHAR